MGFINSLGLSVLLAGNFAKDAPVTKYSRELITQIDASEYMHVKAVLNVATKPDELFIVTRRSDYGIRSDLPNHQQSQRQILCRKNKTTT